MRRREFVTLLGGAAAWPIAARGQQLANLRTMGYLNTSTSAYAQPFARIFFDALSELGWIEGKNLVVERRYAPERLPELAAELVRLNVEVIVAAGTLGPLAAKQATSVLHAK